jgi:hypothetical protein
MSSIRSFFGVSLAVVSSLVAVGCASETSSPEAEEGVGQTSEALCSDTSLAPNATLALGAPGTTVLSVSPSATYGSSACAGDYVVEFTGMKGQETSIDVGWGNPGLLPATKQACPFAVVTATIYGFNPAHIVLTPSGPKIVAASWSQIANQSAGGQWTDPVPPGDPQLVPVGCHIDLPYFPSGSYDHIRVAAKAAGFAIFTAVPEQVSVSANHHPVLK